MPTLDPAQRPPGKPGASVAGGVPPQRGLHAKYEQVKAILRKFRRVLVAYSGGVDSTLLAKIACDVLGKAQVLAVTADSPSMAREDLAVAVDLAAQLDLHHLVVPTQEVANPAYRVNRATRCYVCKQELFEELEALARQRGFPVLLYGAIGDDAPGERPGQRAAAERGVRAPLQEAGLEKWEVRELARRLGIANWDRPQNACLSSRIPHGSEVTQEKLKQIEDAEAFLRDHGFRQVRVRHLGAHARIEVEAAGVWRFEDNTLRREILEAFGRMGFMSIGVERAGYRPGGADAPAVDELILRVNGGVAQLVRAGES